MSNLTPEEAYSTELQIAFRHHPYKESIIEALEANNYTPLEAIQWFSEAEWYTEEHVKGLMKEVHHD